MVKAYIKLGALPRKLDNLRRIKKSFDDSSFFIELGSLVNGSIQRRVQNKGLDKNLSAMQPYNINYKTFRDSRGRQSDYRDLTFFGKMWQSLSVSGVSKGARMFFNGEESSKKALYNQERSDFFGLSQNEKKLIRKELNKHIKL